MKVMGKAGIVVPAAVLKAVVSHDRVDEAPHSFYKYPARFSPVFAREVLRAFTCRGDSVIDPFWGVALRSLKRSPVQNFPLVMN